MFQEHIIEGGGGGQEVETPVKNKVRERYRKKKM